MTRTIALLTGALAWLGPSAVLAQAPRVVIEAPHAGVVRGPLVDFEARVENAGGALHATLVVNGAAYDVPIEQGRVRQRVVVVPGQNRVGLAVTAGGQTTRESLTFRAEGAAAELMVILSWPSEGEIVDLWVREPGGETCKWDHRTTASGGHLLDFSTDAIGFGSQAYVLPEARAGSFRVKLHYWGSWAERDRRGRDHYEDLLGQLDVLERRIAAWGHGPEVAAYEERAARIRRRLDAWATPGAPQTAVRAEVVLFPNTPYERRWRFERVVHRTGQLVTLGDIEIDEATIAAARQGAQ